MSTLASALPAEGEGGFAPGRPLWDPAPEKRYAALFAAWGKDCYWEAEVVEDEHGPRVVSVVESPEAPGASDRVQFERTDVKTVADAIQLAERLRDEAVEQRRATDGPPTRVDMVIEETGRGERMEALKRARSWWPGRRPEPKQYALLVARWQAIEWVAAVVEDDLGLRVVHLHNPGCSDGSCGIDTTRPSWAVADAVLLAEKKRDEMVAACLPYWGQPDSIDTFVEPTGDTERFEARIQAGPEPPRPPAAEADRAHGMAAAAGVAAVVALSAATRSSSRVGWILAGLAVLGVALVALGWTVWRDRQVVRHWRRALAEAREEQRERLAGHARRLRIRRSRVTVSEVPQERAAR